MAIEKTIWTEEVVNKLNEQQKNPNLHPYTCSDAGKHGKCERTNGTGNGALIATKQGWVCPCGEYKQDWAH